MQNNTPDKKGPKPDLGRIMAVIRVRENGVELSEFTSRSNKIDPKIRLLVYSLMERYTREWAVVKNFSESDMQKWNRDGWKYWYDNDMDEAVTLALKNILREKENIEEIGRAYR